MLIDIEFCVEVTNDGEGNYAALKVDKDVKVNELATSIAMAERNLADMLKKYAFKRGVETEQEFEEIYKTITLNDLYEEVGDHRGPLINADFHDYHDCDMGE